MGTKLIVATSQFPVNAEINKNLAYMKKQIEWAAEKNADLIHFPECCLSSYAGIDFSEFTSKNTEKIARGIAKMCEMAQLHNIWIVFGTHVFDGDSKKPFNSLFVINNSGEIESRYDKRILSGFDLDWYNSGSEPVIFKINGINCGLLICHEWRYPELYRQYYKLDVELLLQSWYDGNLSEEEYLTEGKNLGEVILGFVRGNAANNKLWISGANTSKKQQSFPAFVTRPDGFVVGKLKRNISGVLITEIDFDQEYLDLSSHLRDMVINMNY